VTPRSTALHGKGPLEASKKDQWVQAAERAVLDMLDDQLAIVGPELEARLSDTGFVLDGDHFHFDPHILSEAKRQLETLGALSHEHHVTRGGGQVTALVPADVRRRRTAVSKRVARKTMLYRRFLRLSRTAGEAGELVLRSSLQRAADEGVPYVPMQPQFGEVSELLGERPYGAFDSGAYMHHLDNKGIPTRPIALPVEVKNRRLTLYPIHKEVHQLLSKAAAIQAAHPDYPITPVLICRKAHARLFWMAADLGFRVWATRRQFVYTTKDIDERKVREIQDELGISDLQIVDRRNPPRIEKFLVTSLPSQAEPASQHWSTYAEVIQPYADELRKDDVIPAERQLLVDRLRDEVVELHRQWGMDPPFTWAVSEDEVHETQDDA
jgi:hypothetical protein